MIANILFFKLGVNANVIELERVHIFLPVNDISGSSYCYSVPSYQQWWVFTGSVKVEYRPCTKLNKAHRSVVIIKDFILSTIMLVLHE